LSINFAALKKLGQSYYYVFSWNFRYIIGGPFALYIVGSFYPEVANGEEVWKGLSTIAGSWIGGGANQTAMLEVFGASKSMFAQMIAVDVLVANLWMGFYFMELKKSDKIDKWLKADNAHSRIRKNSKKNKQVKETANN
jgi:uncharacterized membrane protein